MKTLSVLGLLTIASIGFAADKAPKEISRCEFSVPTGVDPTDHGLIIVTEIDDSQKLRANVLLDIQGEQSTYVNEDTEVMVHEDLGNESDQKFLSNLLAFVGLSKIKVSDVHTMKAYAVMPQSEGGDGDGAEIIELLDKDGKRLGAVLRFGWGFLRCK